MSADVGEVKDGKGEAGEATHVHFVEGASPLAALTELFYALSTCGR